MNVTVSPVASYFLLSPGIRSHPTDSSRPDYSVMYTAVLLVNRISANASRLAHARNYSKTSTNLTGPRDSISRAKCPTCRDTQTRLADSTDLPTCNHEEPPPSQEAPRLEFSVNPSTDRFKETSRAGKGVGGEEQRAYFL